jgi:hypothetical protein
MKLTLCIVEFAVADIGDIKWSLSPPDCLKIPMRIKKLLSPLQSLRRLESLTACSMTSWLEKDGGLIVLLCMSLPSWIRFSLPDRYNSGPPGVGKTLTAKEYLNSSKNDSTQRAYSLRNLTWFDLTRMQISAREFGIEASFPASFKSRTSEMQC